MKTFSMMMLHPWDDRRAPEVFTEQTAPDWLTCAKTIKGSTMDDRWFWNDHVLKLYVGQYVDTDFRRIFRIS
jgi:hypothetical protein